MAHRMSDEEVNAILSELRRQREVAQNRCVELCVEIARLQAPPKAESGDE